MEKLTEFHLSNLLNKFVYDEFEDCIGRLQDIYVTTEGGYPRAIGYQIRKGRDIYNFEFRSIDVFKHNGNYLIKVRQVKDIIPRKYSYLLSKNLLSKQIVDINGKKIVKVTDLRLVKSNGEINVVEVESGVLATARKLGFENTVKGLYGLFGKDPKENVVTWESVQSLEMVENGLQLTTAYNKLSQLHPADIAEIIAGLSPEDRVKVLEGLDNDLAADTLEELDKEIQQEILTSLSEGKARELLDLIPNDEIADILDELDEEIANKVLINVNDDDENEIRDLMKYEDEVVGSIMNPDFISFNIDITVAETMNILRELKPEDEVSHYIYIIDKDEKLQGFVSLRDLIIAEPDSKLKSIMSTKIFKVRDTDEIEKAIGIAVKYDLYSLPVIDEEDKLCGVAVMNDIIDELLSPSWRRKIRKSG
jgi:CBS domain-containing protein